MKGQLMHARLRTRLKLELLSQLRRGKPASELAGYGDVGFTLIELIIVVAVVGLLAAVALPSFLAARARADASARVGELIGLARECASDMAAMVTNEISYSDQSVICGASSPTTGVAFELGFMQGANGVRCLTATSLGNQDTVLVRVRTDGSIRCSFM